MTSGYGELTPEMDALAEWRVVNNAEGYGRFRPRSQKGRGMGLLHCLKCGMRITHPHRSTCPTLAHERTIGGTE